MPTRTVKSDTAPRKRKSAGKQKSPLDRTVKSCEGAFGFIALCEGGRASAHEHLLRWRFPVGAAQARPLPWRAQRPLASVPVALQLPVLNPIEGLLEASRRGQYPWMLLFYMLFQRLRLRDLCS